MWCKTTSQYCQHINHVNHVLTNYHHSCLQSSNIIQAKPSRCSSAIKKCQVQRGVSSHQAAPDFRISGQMMWRMPARPTKTGSYWRIWPFMIISPHQQTLTLSSSPTGNTTPQKPRSCWPLIASSTPSTRALLQSSSPSILVSPSTPSITHSS